MNLAQAPYPVARISLTALVDVVFILLFFFMLASRSMDWRAVQVTLSETTAQSASRESDRPRAVMVLGSGDLHDGTQSVPQADIADFVAAQSADSHFVLVPAPEASAQTLIGVFERFEQGAAAVSLARLPR